jgi:FtsP/CotA-like multicopper oxidase with cupredoxin domain
MFAPLHAGTYMYHCHQEADIHVTMGMYGALVVYNPADAAATTGPGKGSGGTLHGWAYDKDYVLLLSETDTRQHNAEQKGGLAGGYNPVDFKPQYWFINGLSFPNTVHAGIGFTWATWSAAHPNYDPFITGSVTGGTTGNPGEKVLLRVINMGFQTQPMHMHGFHAKIIGSDQRAWPWANSPGTPPGLGMEKNTLTIGSGETYEWLIDFGTLAAKGATSTYNPGTQSRYNPVGNVPVANGVGTSPAIPDPFAPGFAYVGGPVVGPDNLASQGTGGLAPELPYTTGQYFPFHNHDDYKATNNGVYPGGMFTLIMTLP